MLRVCDELVWAAFGVLAMLTRPNIFGFWLHAGHGHVAYYWYCCYYDSVDGWILAIGSVFSVAFSFLTNSFWKFARKLHLHFVCSFC